MGSAGALLPSLGQCCSRAAGPGSALVSSPRAGAPRARRVPPRGPGMFPLTAAQAAPSGPGHLLPMLFEPSAAAIKSPPLPSPTLKELDLKLI